MDPVGQEFGLGTEETSLSLVQCVWDLSWKDLKVELTQLLGTGIIWRLLLMLTFLGGGRGPSSHRQLPFLTVLEEISSLIPFR